MLFVPLLKNIICFISKKRMLIVCFTTKRHYLWRYWLDSNQRRNKSFHCCEHPCKFIHALSMRYVFLYLVKNPYFFLSFCSNNIKCFFIAIACIIVFASSSVSLSVCLLANNMIIFAFLNITLSKSFNLRQSPSK